MRLKDVENIILEGYKDVTQKFYQSAEKQQVDEVIAKFKTLVNRNQLQGNEKNIDWWGKQGWEKFKEKVEFQSQQKTSTELKKQKIPGQSIFLAENEKWLIVIPLDKEASCFHGKNTSWCTTKPYQPYFERYFYQDGVTLIYFIRKTDGGKWAIAVDRDNYATYFDVEDKEIEADKFKDQTGLDSTKFIKLAQEKQDTIGKSRQSYKELYKQTEVMINNAADEKNRERNEKIEAALMKLKGRNILADYLYVVSEQDFPLNFQKFMINMSGNNLQYINNPTEQIIKTALSQNGNAIKYVKNPQKEMQLIAINNSFQAFKFINVDDLYPEVIEQQLQRHPDSIATLIDNKYPITQKMVDIAVASGIRVFKIPQKFLGEEQFLAAVKSKQYNYDDVPIKFRHKKEFMIAALRNANLYATKNLKLMKPELFDEDIIEAALYNNDANMYSIIGTLMAMMSKEQIKQYQDIISERFKQVTDT